MAKGRRSRMDLRREAEAVEARKRDDDAEVEGEVEDEEDEDDEEGDADAEAEGDAEGDPEVDIDLDAEIDPDASDDEGDDEDAKPKKKKPKKAPPKKPKKAPGKRRTAKEVRTRAVWVVFDNGSKVVDKFPYNQREEAEALLAKKLEEKKTFYLNLVKEEIKE